MHRRTRSHLFEPHGTTGCSRVEYSVVLPSNISLDTATAGVRRSESSDVSVISVAGDVFVSDDYICGGLANQRMSCFATKHR